MTQFEDRLIAWNRLRNENSDNNLQSALLAVNNWWQMLPLDMHYLHWDDDKNWPDPWDILADGVFCDLTKCLGIVYTLHLIGRKEINDIVLAQTTEGDNLVLINNGKYILNWAPGEILNTATSKLQITRTMDASIAITKIH